jgi:sulfate permease, SulP family
LAGINLAAVGIPEVMGYTEIIDTPVITGLLMMLLLLLPRSGCSDTMHSFNC